MITQDQISAFAPQAIDPPSLVTALNDTIDRFLINTPRRVRYFMAQAYFESAGFSSYSENLFYSHADRLVAVWPSHFTLTQGDPNKAYAPDYVGNPQKLANYIYANRNGNGDEASGDGWNYRGQGAFALTGKGNFQVCSSALYGDDRLVSTPSLVQQYDGAVMTAGWFWSTRRLNELADSDSFTQATTIINGSGVTAPERLVVLNKANLIF